MSVRPAKTDQPGHPPSLIRVFAVRMKKAWVLSYPWSAQRRLWSDWTDAQADRSLSWAHSHIVGFVMSRLKCASDKQYFVLLLSDMFYHKFPKYSDTQNICCNHSKIWTMWLYHRVMSPNDADGMANSVDPDQTAPLWSGSALFAQVYLSKNLGSLRYLTTAI